MKREELTQEYLKECLYYNTETGIFTWKERPLKHFKTKRICNSWNKKMSYKIANSINNSGYIRIGINGVRILSHRLAWFYIHGVWPKNQIDHVNGITTDNRLCNIREANNSENQQNLKKQNSNNKSSGFLGVRYHIRLNKFEARIKINGKLNYLGLFKTPEEAHEVYLKAKRELHPFGTI